MTTEEKIVKFNMANDNLLRVLTNSFGFQDAAFVYTWKWTLLALLTAWGNEVRELDSMDDTTV